MSIDERRKAVVLLSGGIDSSTTLAIARAEGYGLYALSFDYNQRHRRELESAKMVASALGVERHLIITFDLREIGGSALTSDMEVPKQRMKDESGRMNQGTDTERKDISPFIPHPSSFIPVTYVPARNTIFLSFALGWAEALGAGDIFLGANAVDYSGYPDCRPGYLRAFEEMANLATKASVEGKLRFGIRAPLLFMTKAEIVRKGHELGLDYSITWSCYDPQPASAGVQSSKFRVRSARKQPRTRNPEPGTVLAPCGRCDSCVFRAKGFSEAGFKDPLA